MYLNNQLGDNQLGQGFSASSFASTGASIVARSIATMIPSISSFAGPIGMVVGGLVSLFMSLFGPDPKKPIFGLTIIVPQGQKPTFGKLLAYFQKPQFDWQEGWGLHKPELIAVASQHVDSLLSAGVPGGIILESGGLPEAVQAGKKTDFAGITNHLRQVAQPYVAIVNAITDENIKTELMNAPLPYSQAKNYYLNLDLYKNPKNFREPLKVKWDEYAITGKNQDLKKTLDKGFGSMLSEMNKIIASKTGIDAQTGQIVNQQLADIAFRPSPLASIGGGSFWPWILLGGLILFSGNKS